MENWVNVKVTGVQMKMVKMGRGPMNFRVPSPLGAKVDRELVLLGVHMWTFFFLLRLFCNHDVGCYKQPRNGGGILKS